MRFIMDHFRKRIDSFERIYR